MDPTDDLPDNIRRLIPFGDSLSVRRSSLKPPNPILPPFDGGQTMPGQLLPFRPLDYPGPRGASVLGRAFPFKLKYLALSSRPRRLLSLGHDSAAGHRRTSLLVESSGAPGKRKALIEEDTRVGGWSDDWESEEMERDGRRSGRPKSRTRVRGDGGNPKPLVRDAASSKRSRDSDSKFLQVIGNGKQNQNAGVDESLLRRSRGLLKKKRSFSHLDEVDEEDERNVECDSINDVPNDGGKIKQGMSGNASGAAASPEIERLSSIAEDESYLSETRFENCSLSPLSLKGIEAAGYVMMTLVQEATLPLILEGKDVLAKAKTGTGKTVAFLLPAIEVISRLPPVSHDKKRPSINVLVICPTRELALQAAAEANKLLKYHPLIGVQAILIATPGRLKDHIENTTGFVSRLNGVKVLVLDEADRLLDMGFRKDIEKIIATVPKQRQTLLFSATVPNEVHQICHIALKKDYKFISTVDEGSEETHSQVKQMHLIAPLDKHFSILYSLLKEHILEDADYKVIVFCTTAMVTKLVADLLTKLHLNVREIHSRKPQNYRTRVSEEFRQSKGLILVSSDVSARGVDYPDVTLVIQVGLPADREQYIHRLGRTGRKGKEGKGLLMLAPWEKLFLASVQDLPITEAPVPSMDRSTMEEVEQALELVEMKNKESAYQAWLGYYNSNKKIGETSETCGTGKGVQSELGPSRSSCDTKAYPKEDGPSQRPGLRSK
ncbi:Type III restriction enzyme, res subunit [Musa troglodytarum]|uniref:ATP-dependent RNA helicase n=1 Tax=Musa troglodytarum TaxID=320322 RepID=A0A9E7I0S2_9LILI|nr:Type III restriction enzyme, res subunit [Musa troglodytarum]